MVEKISVNEQEMTKDRWRAPIFEKMKKGEKCLNNVVTSGTAHSENDIVDKDP